MIASEDRGAAFVAQVTAGTTHEIRNILAIVKESAGLIEDLIFAFKRRGSLDQDKLTRSLQRIDAQVARGTELLANLNRFAHSLDPVQDAIDVTREIQQLVYLCQFRARRKRHVLQVQPGGQNLTAVVDPFRFQMSLFGAVECCLEQLPEGSTVLISADRRENRPTVEFALLDYDEDANRTLSYELGPEEARKQLDERRQAAEKIEHEIPAEFLGIGVRIEDDVLITEDGYRNLSAGVPTDPDEIEAICAEPSVLPKL